LLTERGKRLRAGLEFHAQFLNGQPVPSWLCGGKLNDVWADPMWDIAHNAYVNVQHQAMPQTTTLLQRIRPTWADHHMVWETLTHASIGEAGLVAPWRVVGRASNKCLDVAAAGTADGARIQLWSCNGTGAQSYRTQDAGGGFVTLVNTGSNKCVDVAGAGTADGIGIQLWTCNGTNAQRFRLQDAGSGFASIVNAGSGKCLGVESSSTSDGAGIKQWSCANSPSQQWKVGG